MGAKRTISRMDAVSNQLDTACKAYFLWDDLVSAITLAGAAERVMSDIQPQDGIFGVDAASIRSLINLHVTPEGAKEAARLLRADYDFFRHADKKTQSEYEINEYVADFWIFISLASFNYLKQPTTKAMRAYTHWFFIKYPHLLKEGDGEYNTLVTKMAEDAKHFTKLQFYEVCTSKDPYA